METQQPVEKGRLNLASRSPVNYWTWVLIFSSAKWQVINPTNLFQVDKIINDNIAGWHSSSPKTLVSFALKELRRPRGLTLQRCLDTPRPVILPTENVCCVTKYLQPVTGASSLCEVTLEDFLPIRNVIPAVFCYFPDLRLIVDIFLRSYSLTVFRFLLT